MDANFVKNESTVLGVDVGGTKILIGRIDREGGVCERRRYPMDRTTQKAAINSIYSAIDSYMKEIAGGLKPLAIGIGLVGHVDSVRGIWLGSMNIPINEPVPMSDAIGGKYDIPVFLDNDVHSATLAELRFGAGKNVSDFIYVNIGTGLAAGIVCNGRLVRGSDNYAGEFGHITVEPEGELCKCGRQGCLEMASSGGAMVASARALLGKYKNSSLNKLSEESRLTATAIFEEADKGDELARLISNRALNGICTGMVDLINLLNPGMVVFGGGVFNGGWLLDRIRSHINDYALKACKNALKDIVPTRLDVDLAGMIGAACVAWSSLENTRINEEMERK